MTIDEFDDLVGKVTAFAIGIPLVLVSLLVAQWRGATIVRLTRMIQMPDPIDWLPADWTQNLPLPG